MTVNSLLLKRSVFLSWLFVFLFIPFAKADYVKNQPYQVTQPDGKVINCYVSGDEFYNWLHDAQGYTIIQAEDGYFYYGIKKGEVVVPSSFKVGDTDPLVLNIEKWAKASTQVYQQRKKLADPETDNFESIQAPHEGILNNIAVYIRFSDDTEFPNARQSYENSFNKSDAVSVKSYFDEVSYNKLSINTTGYPACELTTNLSYQDTHARNYFRPYNAVSNPIGYNGETERRTREHILLSDAIKWININSPVPGTLNVDGDGDGNVDNVCFIIRGGNDAWNTLLWAHRWSLYTQSVSINGKRVYDYTFQPETMVEVRTLCHEMFHALGSPDLYHYDDKGLNIDPVYTWDIMEYGGGHMGAYMKWKYTNHSWISSIPEITTSGTYSLQPLTSTTNNCYKIASPNSVDEFFVVEYRKKEGMYEGNLQGSGLLVYRIDTRKTGNAGGPPDEVYIYRPNGTTSVNGSPGSAYYSESSGRKAINDGTNPSSFLQDGSEGGLNIFDVTAAGSTISFSVGITTVANPLSFSASEVSLSQINLSWQKNIAANNVVLAYSSSPTFGVPVSGTSYSAGDVIPGGGTVIYAGSGEVYSHTSLVAGYTYYYKIWSVDALKSYSSGKTASAKINHVAITTASNPIAGGTTSGSGTYTAGAQVSVTAIAATGYKFVNWKSGTNVLSTSATYTFNPNFSLDLVANFEVQNYTISVSANPSLGGVVSGGGVYAHNAPVTLVATPNTGWYFTGWYENEGKESDNLSYTFNALGTRNLVATFTQTVQNYTINIFADPAAGGVVTGGGTKAAGTLVTVQATENPDWVFTNWTENGIVVSTNKTYTFTAASNRTLRANFVSHTVKVTTSSFPTVGGITTGDGNYSTGEPITITATPAQGYRFVVWKRGSNIEWLTANVVFYTYTANNILDLVAHFEILKYNINLSVNPSLGGVVSGGGEYSHNAPVTIVATANPGWIFTGWYENGSKISDNATFTFTALSNRNIEAQFQQVYQITIFADPAAGGVVTGGGTKAAGTLVTVQATENPDWVFTNWTENGIVVSTNKTYTFTAASNRTLRANFVSHTVKVTTSSFPTVGGITTGDGNYSTGEPITITATPAQGYRFVVWKRGSNIEWLTANVVFYTYTANNILDLVAHFEILKYNINLSVNPSLGGVVSGGGEYSHNAPVTIVATANPGWIFTGWYENGSKISDNATFTFTALSNRNIEAQFQQVYQITIFADPAAGGVVTGGGTKAAGTLVTVQATENPDWVFTNWTENGIVVSTNKTYTFTAASNRTLRANFVSHTVKVTTSSFPTVGGITTGDGNYSTGEPITITATPAQGYRFVVWKRGSNIEWLTANVVFYTYTANNILDLVAHFEILKYNINLSVNPSLGGVVSGGGEYTHNAPVTIVATANPGWIFTGWYENGSKISDNASYTFTAQNNRNIEAQFIQQTYQINLSANPTDGGVVSGGGTKSSGTQVTVQATENPNWVFTNWTENGTIVSTNKSYTFTATSNRTLVANFGVNLVTVLLASNLSSAGILTGNGAYSLGSQVVVSAVSNDGYKFLNWTVNGYVASTSPTYIFTVNNSVELVANFERLNFVITTSANPSNGGTVSGGGSFPYNTPVTLVATPAQGWDFVGWEQNGLKVSSNASFTFNVVANRNFVARFIQQTYNVDIQANPSEGGVLTGGGSVTFGTHVTVKATSHSGWKFVNWTQSGSVVSTNSSHSFIVSDHNNLTANFIQVFSVIATANPANAGSVTGAGSYDVGTTVNLIAIENTDYKFYNWTENGTIVSTQQNFTYVLNGNKTVVANFLSTVDIPENEAASISVYPNPTHGIIYVKTGDLAIRSIEITDALGRVVTSVSPVGRNPQISLNLSNCISGIYVVKVKQENGMMVTRKVVLQR